jgi:hypothetical protein
VVGYQMKIPSWTDQHHPWNQSFYFQRWTANLGLALFGMETTCAPTTWPPVSRAARCDLFGFLSAILANSDNMDPFKLITSWHPSNLIRTWWQTGVIWVWNLDKSRVGWWNQVIHSISKVIEPMESIFHVAHKMQSK